MSKYTPLTLQGGIYSRAQIQSSIEEISRIINDEMLSRENQTGEPNQMEQELDMNSNPIINLGTSTNGNSAVTLDQVNELIAGLLGGLGNFEGYIGTVSQFRETQTATAGQTIVGLTTINYTQGINNLTVYVDGRYKLNGVDYVETDTDTVTFNNPFNGGESLVFITNEATSTDYPARNFYNSFEFVATAGQSTYPTNINALSDLPEATAVYVNGLIQAGNYSVSSAGEVVFDASAAAEVLAGDNVVVRTQASYSVTDNQINGINISVFAGGTPDGGVITLRYDAATAFTLPLSLTNSQASCEVAPVGEVVFDIQKNSVSVGSITFAASSAVGTFTFPTEQSIAIGDKLDIVSPLNLQLLEDLSITLRGVKS